MKFWIDRAAIDCITQRITRRVMTGLRVQSLLGCLMVGLFCCSLALATPAIAAETQGSAPHSAPVGSHSLQSLSLPPSGLMLGSIFGGLFAGSRPDNLGSTDGQLSPCPGSPNCVCSHTDSADAEHAISPLGFSGAGDSAFAALTDIVKAYDNTTVVTEEAGYLYAEFKTPLMGFVDDVEFFLSPAESVIHVRSASRLGQSDLGLNRQRVETLRTELESAIAPNAA